MVTDREVDGESRDESGSFASAIVRGTSTLRRGDTAGRGEGMMTSTSAGNRTRCRIERRPSGTAEGVRREGLGPRASMPEFAGLVPATRGLIAAPWTPASLSLWPLRKAVEIDHSAP
jgi:hypothetical protein